MEHDEPVLLKNINVYYNDYKRKNTIYLNLIKCYALMLVIRDLEKRIKDKNLMKSNIVKNLLEDNHDIVAYYIYKVYTIIYKQKLYDKEMMIKLAADIVVKFHTFDYTVILMMKRYYDKFTKYLKNNDIFIINLINKILNIDNDITYYDKKIINNHFKYLNWEID